jgi:hypothetical protein
LRAAGRVACSASEDGRSCGAVRWHRHQNPWRERPTSALLSCGAVGGCSPMFTHFARRYEYLHCRARTVSLLAPASPSDHNKKLAINASLAVATCSRVRDQCQAATRNGPAGTPPTARALRRELVEMGRAGYAFGGCTGQPPVALFTGQAGSPGLEVQQAPTNTRLTN